MVCGQGYVGARNTGVSRFEMNQAPMKAWLADARKDIEVYLTMSSDIRRKRVEKFDPSAWISQSEAARLRGVSRQAIAELVQKNRFRVLKIGGKTLLNRLDVERYHPQQPGPESQKKHTK